MAFIFLPSFLPSFLPPPPPPSYCLIKCKVPRLRACLILRQPSWFLRRRRRQKDNENTGENDHIHSLFPCIERICHYYRYGSDKLCKWSEFNFKRRYTVSSLKELIFLEINLWEASVGRPCIGKKRSRLHSYQNKQSKTKMATLKI